MGRTTPGERQGRRERKQKAIVSFADRPEFPEWLETLPDALTQSSPLKNERAKRELAQLAQLQQSEVARLMKASLEGVISAEESRSLAPLSAQVIKTLQALDLLKTNDDDPIDLLGGAARGEGSDE